MKIVFPSVYFGRTRETWLCYSQLPFYFRGRYGIIYLNESNFALPVPFRLRGAF